MPLGDFLVSTLNIAVLFGVPSSNVMSSILLVGVSVCHSAAITLNMYPSPAVSNEYDAGIPPCTLFIV